MWLAYRLLDSTVMSWKIIPSRPCDLHMTLLPNRLFNVLVITNVFEYKRVVQVVRFKKPFVCYTPRGMAHINTWRVFVGHTATGKTRYANFLEAQGGQAQQEGQAHGVQIIEELGPTHVHHMANILENVRHDVQEVVLVTNFPCVVQAAVNIVKNTYDMDPAVWLFARHDGVDLWMQRLEGSVQKVMIPEDERNPNGAWQEIFCDDLING